jgi:hypothetical protein
MCLHCPGYRAGCTVKVCSSWDFYRKYTTQTCVCAFCMCLRCSALPWLFCGRVHRRSVQQFGPLQTLHQSNCCVLFACACTALVVAAGCAGADQACVETRRPLPRSHAGRADNAGEGDTRGHDPVMTVLDRPIRFSILNIIRHLQMNVFHWVRSLLAWYFTYSPADVITHWHTDATSAL